MSYAQELKNLVAEIKTGHRDRKADIGKIKRETRDILSAADIYMKKVATEIKDAAKELENFLAKSEENRKKDFTVIMGGIQNQLKELKGYVKDLLVKNEASRVADFKAVMGDVKRIVKGIQQETRGKLGDYKAERKEAAGYWDSLRKRGAAPEIETETEEEVVAPKKRKARRKRKK